MEDRNPQILRGSLADLNELRGETSVLLSETILFSDTVKATWKDDDDQAVFESVDGKVIVTTDRILFVSKIQEAHDVAVDSECILLHATAQDPPSIYLQLQEMTAEMAAPMEFTFIPDTETSCQPFFEALSKLVSMHPIDDDDADDGGEGDEGLMYMGPVEVENDETAPDGRQVMLDRLDNLLEVPPHLEVQDGQFDDADELL
jgi:Regulator of volume decrease after cellular swelling